MGDASNVVVGSGRLFIAPIGTTLPTLTTLVETSDGDFRPTWPAGWELVGYTKDGIEVEYQPTYKDIEVDEEMSPVKIILVKENGSIKANLSESTLQNLNTAISASILSSATAGGNDQTILEFGSGQPEEVMVGFDGPAPGDGICRVIIAFRAMSVAAVGLKYSRENEVVIPLELRVLADGTKAKGKRMVKAVDIGEDVAS